MHKNIYILSKNICRFPCTTASPRTCTCPPRRSSTVRSVCCPTPRQVRFVIKIFVHSEKYCAHKLWQPCPRTEAEMSPHSRLRSPATEEDQEAVILLGDWGGWQLPGRRRLEEAVTCYHVSICCVFQYLNTNPHTQPPPLDRPTSKVGPVTILGTFIYTSSFFRLLKSKLVDLDCCLSINLFIYLIYSNKINV